MRDWFDVTAWQAWLGTTMGVEVSRERLVAIGLQLAWIALALLIALAIRRATCAATDRLVERIDLRLRPPRLMRALRPLVVVALWWLLIVAVGRAAWFFGEKANGLRIAASLLLAWMAAHALSGLLRDRFAARLIGGVIWLIAALDILGVLDIVSAALDTVGVTLGAVRLSLLTVVKGALLLTALLWAAGALAKAVRIRVSKVASLTPSVQVLIGNLAKMGLLTLAVLVALNAVGIDLTAFAVFSGAIGLGLGFGLQKIVSNLISGVILLLDRSIKPGDVIEIEKTYGWITSLGARYVSVRGRDGKEYLIPNEDLITHRVTNWSYSSDLVRLDVPFGVAYESDLRQVRTLAVEAGKVPERVVKVPAPVCHITEFGESTVNLLLRFWIRDPANGVTNVKGEVMLALWDAFKAHGVELPSPQRDVRIKELPPVLAHAWSREQAAE